MDLISCQYILFDKRLLERNTLKAFFGGFNQVIPIQIVIIQHEARNQGWYAHFFFEKASQLLSFDILNRLVK